MAPTDAERMSQAIDKALEHAEAKQFDDSLKETDASYDPARGAAALVKQFWADSKFIEANLAKADDVDEIKVVFIEVLGLYRMIAAKTLTVLPVAAATDSTTAPASGPGGAQLMKLTATVADLLRERTMLPAVQAVGLVKKLLNDSLTIEANLAKADDVNTLRTEFIEFLELYRMIAGETLTVLAGAGAGTAATASTTAPASGPDGVLSAKLAELGRELAEERDARIAAEEAATHS